MTDKPLFSVLIANYNNGKYLMDAIESVKAQTYTNWEIIIVDDGSTDNSQELYKQLELDSRIHVFYNDENKGCGCTKRRCAELANGEICGFLDPDDALENEALEIMVGEHVKYKDASLVYSRFFYADESLNSVGVSEHQCVLPNGISFLEYGKGAISHFATFKKTFYDKTVGINMSHKRAIDHELYFLLEEVGKVHFIDKALYYYRDNTGSNLSTNSNSKVAFLWDLIIMAEACQRRGLEIEKVVLPRFIDFMESERAFYFLKGQDDVRNTRTYKVGKTILKPLKRMKLD